MTIFNKENTHRLDDKELREFYLDSKIADKRLSIYCMVIFSLLSIAIIWFSVAQKLYWIMFFAIVTVISLIYHISRFSSVIEEIFENRVTD